MILTEEQKRQLETGGMDPNIPLAATKTRHWPKIIPYDMDSSICKYGHTIEITFCYEKQQHRSGINGIKLCTSVFMIVLWSSVC